jgi:hypothetical protein
MARLKRILFFLGMQAILLLVLSAGTVHADNDPSSDPAIQNANRAVDSANQTLHNLPQGDDSYAYPGGRVLDTYGTCSNYHDYTRPYRQNVRLVANSGEIVIIRWDGLGNIAVPGVYIWINGIYEGHYKIPVSVDDLQTTTRSQLVYGFHLGSWETYTKFTPVVQVCPGWTVS